MSDTEPELSAAFNSETELVEEDTHSAASASPLPSDTEPEAEQMLSKLRRALN